MDGKNWKIGIDEVAPRAGAWIEMFMSKMGKRSWRVAPRAGAWIEICACKYH